MRGDIARPILQPPSGQEVRRRSLIVPSPGGFPAGTLVESERIGWGELKRTPTQAIERSCRNVGVRKLTPTYMRFRGFGDAPLLSPHSMPGRAWIEVRPAFPINAAETAKASLDMTCGGGGGGTPTNRRDTSARRTPSGFFNNEAQRRTG
jgi:hypothetical protein